MTSASSSTPRSANPQHVLIVGGDGTIGSALNKRLLAKGYQVTCSTRRPGVYSDTSLFLDLQDPESFLPIKERRFDAAVLCGAITSIQKCEENPERTRQVNVDGTLALADLLAEAGSHLVFLSTNMVFDGIKPNAQSSDARNPLTEYGKQKAEVETWLVSEKPSAAIIRFGKVLPPQFPLFAQWQKQLISCNPIRPHANKSIAPISLEMAIMILSWLVDGRKPGIFQATANSDITYPEAALYIAHRYNANPSLVKPVNAQDQSGNGRRLTHVNIFNTLQISPDFPRLFGNFSPLKAVDYSIQNEAFYVMNSH